jgi:lysophospholipase L1-like esterase
LTSPSPRRQRLFLALTLALPLLFFAAVEGVLRIVWPAGALPAFEAVPVRGGDLVVPSPRLGRRYFAGEEHPPVPPTDAFARRKPARGFRVFVLGESSAAGFPYPHNGTFSRVIRDALRDVLPGDSIEVVNLGLAATNSFTLVDLTQDVVDQHPDVVIVYAGHNEYYGALGVGSTVRIGSSPRLTRLYLRAQRLRTVAALRHVVTGLVRGRRTAATDSSAATFMESVAADQRIELGGHAYDAGIAQFRDNLTILLSTLRDARVPVLIASIASNVRDQPPFVSAANAAARTAYDDARRALAAGDSSRARALFVRARDLDVVRFRAPGAFNDVIRNVAATTGARYVPVAERFNELSPAHAPGHELFLEHVHPNRRGYALIARSFVETLLEGELRDRADRARLDSWDRYEARMELTPFDEQIVRHAVATITGRWPFVARDVSRYYRGTYRPVDTADSLALAVSRGGLPWAEAKVRIGAAMESRGRIDSALAEYRGLVRDAPFLELPNRLTGRALAAAGRLTEAKPYLERALHIQPSADAAYLLGEIALREKDYPRAIALLDAATRMAPTAPGPVYQLSLAFGLSRNIGAARGAAARVAQLDPSFPGLAEWMNTLGMRSR